ncbi:MAG: sugar-binding domain-containing protein [Chitinophagaceae bacterium]
MNSTTTSSCLHRHLHGIARTISSSATSLTDASYMKKIYPCIYFLIFLLPFHSSSQGRTETDISLHSWKLLPDPDAKWIDDTLFPPPVSVEKLRHNPPTGGWDALKTSTAISVTLPATVEQYFWGANGNSFGVSGNYLGVSWFYTSLDIPAALQGKRVTLQFEAVRFRAEIYVNRKLAGYDLINSTPFEVDISRHVMYGSSNEIAIRITDPNGNFDWRDSQTFMWGKYRTNPTHGFGGITGKVKLVSTDAVYISDIYIKNKPAVNEVDAVLTLNNTTGSDASGVLSLIVKEARPGGKQVYHKKISNVSLAPGEQIQTQTIRVNNAMHWDTDNPNLYTIEARWQSDKANDVATKRFGFRWFEIKDIKGDKQFFLNNKRIVAITSISWGFWPVNGIAPTDELARKQVEDAKRLGMNMLNFHRTIGNENVLDYADELGLLYYEEPGGNQFPANQFNATDEMGKLQRDFYFAARDEKLFRMIRRDRSHPSLVIYNMHNERGAQPQRQDSIQMLAAHQLDETRMITYNSSNGDIKQGPDTRFKLHLLPYDHTFHDYGWFDQHHAGGPGTYHDNLYKKPTDYAKYFDHRDEIIYYGEEGAIGTPPRLQLIREEILRAGKNIGWETDAYLKWYDAYNDFITAKGFGKAFPNVDSLTKAMGNVAYYYQGRVIENVHISNLIDGYAINGWESMKLENHSGIVDNYRNLKGDPGLIGRYNQPLYVSVKLNRKVMATGDTSIADFFIVNRKDLKGKFTLKIKAVDEKGNTLISKSETVSVTGGNTYGELLLKGISIPATSEGYTTVSASLYKNDQLLASGDDKLYAIAFNMKDLPAEGMIADTSGILANYFRSVNLKPKEYKTGRPQGKYLIIGAFQPQQTGNPLVTDILEWVNDGNTLIVVSNTETWATHLGKKEVIDYRGSQAMGTTWYGGNFFSKQHELFNGLPQAQVFNWEYQCFATYNKSRIGLRILNGDPVVAAVSDHKPEVYTALSIIPHGRGKIIISTLDIFSCLKDVKVNRLPEGDGENASMSTFNNSQTNKANVVGQQLLMNMIRFAAK